MGQFSATTMVGGTSPPPRRRGQDRKIHQGSGVSLASAFRVFACGCIAIAATFPSALLAVASGQFHRSSLEALVLANPGTAGRRLEQPHVGAPDLGSAVTTVFNGDRLRIMPTRGAGLASSARYRVVMMGSIPGRHRYGSSNPTRNHRPYGAPFEHSNMAELRRPMTVESGNISAAIAGEHIEALKSEDVEVRRQAIEALWRLTTPTRAGYSRHVSATGRLDDQAASSEVMEALLGAVLDDDWKVRWDAALAIGKLGLQDQFNVDPYIARLAAKLKKDRTSADDKMKLAEAMGKIGTPSQPYSKNVAMNLEHEDRRVRLACAEAFARLGPEAERWRAPLLRLTRDEDEQVRKAAEKVLFKKPWEKPGWLEVQDPAWRVRILRANKGKKRKPPKSTARLR